ncbi:NitT/TauT family transport system ATP-binding protein [Clostridium saccharoperbutylacetonicum]|uniref:Aliphatic sulfonates import ATP-binding protein SsuB n=1 Tax=Clostridium saccharoperbutylacetonicum N1-4(HMT) TaxID=931276 RepID=M1MTM0_9CLOT|nr:ABC transporter ATP-binding protein [Clostridium saccharoperbutylacetonicum]AGF54902.1 aliphatic sulfonates import ATP-binding protein SsuB [Clostridium saccharoperbutylacetonicum N1-4(HMT)]NRT64393.1 NitT/TauT family transport system ATP-binding protein [Clostridium saccharoperbutylacetonicum]NSB27762.1 NitT/TauT family transport system ATP-binding protein [Clostridium saccharoperbutylacetonicum]NSB41249.1 NitT/TauT family transport system ATP-binding protein [Clostridium saccharoperbutylac
MNINIRNLNKAYGSEQILKNFNIEFSDDNINCIVGKSGCGKSTLLNIIAGLIDIQGGEINGAALSDISYIFQEDRLIEWLNVKENLELTLKKYFDSSILDAKIDEVLELVGIYDIKNKYPNELSGGMRQRINIARAFGKPSKIILMDEPFKSLDYKLKYTIIDEFKNLLNKEKRMVILVTHDLDEAIYFQGNIFVFSNKPVIIAGRFSSDLENCKEEILKII